MKFGLFYELQLPKPYDSDQWDPDQEHRIFKDALDQIELADQPGFDYLFDVEHHFPDEYAHPTPPAASTPARPASPPSRRSRLSARDHWGPWNV